MWQPALSTTSLQKVNMQYDETLKQADAIISQADELKAQYARVSNDQKAKMAIMVPDSIDKVRLLSEVKNIEKQTGFSLGELAYSDGNTLSNGRGAAGISFSVKTTYPKFKELMDTFEKSLRLYSIQSISFNVPEKEGDPISYQVKLETYYIK